MITINMIYTTVFIVFLLAALIPPLIMMVLVYRQDKIEKEPIWLVIKLIIFGCISCIPTLYLERLGTVIFSFFFSYETLLYLFIKYFIGVALVEEGCKYFFTWIGSWRNKEFNYRFDGIVYAVSVSIGFAALENVGYVFSYGLQTAAMRAVLSIPLHCICGIFMGHYYGEAKFAEVQGRIAEKKRYQRTAIILPLILHGFYDFAISTDYLIFTFIFYIFVIVLDIVAIKKIRKYSREDIAFYQKKGFDHWRVS